jgi:hypothetical protein
MSLEYIEHTFGPGETIQAIIRKYNHQAMTKSMLESLFIKYNELNGMVVPRPGQKVKIPLFVGFIGTYKPKERK